MKLELLFVKSNFMLSVCTLNIERLDQKHKRPQTHETVVISTGEWFAHSIR